MIPLDRHRAGKDQESHLGQLLEQWSSCLHNFDNGLSVPAKETKKTKNKAP